MDDGLLRSPGGGLLPADPIRISYLENLRFGGAADGDGGDTGGADDAGNDDDDTGASDDPRNTGPHGRVNNMELAGTSSSSSTQPAEVGGSDSDFSEEVMEPPPEEVGDFCSSRQGWLGLAVIWVVLGLAVATGAFFGVSALVCPEMIGCRGGKNSNKDKNMIDNKDKNQAPGENSNKDQNMIDDKNSMQKLNDKDNDSESKNNEIESS